jgi:hypothetical protein
LSAFTGGIANLGGQAGAIGKSTGLTTELLGTPGRVQFVVPGGGTVIQFDATLNEQHSRDSAPTMFPVEDGTNISDHINVAPFELTLTGVISDTPLPDTLTKYAQSLGSAVATLAPPLGIVAEGAAYSLYSSYSAQKARNTQPSITAFNQLLYLQGGNFPSGAKGWPATPFSVLTTYARYNNMVIKSLSFPRDTTTSGQLTVTVALTQIVVVAPQTVNLTNVADANASAGKTLKGEKEARAKNAAIAGEVGGINSTLANIGVPAGLTQ